MECNRDMMLKELMAADFLLIDLGLYLNTHPYEQNAINLYNQNFKRAKVLRENYERLFGPLTLLNCSKCPWQWIQGPWPWEKGY